MQCTCWDHLKDNPRVMGATPEPTWRRYSTSEYEAMSILKSRQGIAAAAKAYAVLGVAMFAV